MKECSQCKELKPLTEFYKDKRAKSGLYSGCKSCHNQQNNAERRKKYIREYHRERRKTDIRFRLNGNIGSAIGHSLRGKKEWAKWIDLVGYNIDDLMKHIEEKFEPWMAWENYGEWHIDHIIPKNRFNYKTPKDAEFKKCWALENLQPLSAEENWSKLR